MVFLMFLKIRSFKELVIAHYTTSILMYNKKNYYNSVMESVYAVESALTNSLNERLPTNEKNKIKKHGLTLGSLIKKDEIKKLLYSPVNDKDILPYPLDEDKVIRFNHFRNMFFHTGNFIALLNETGSGTMNKEIEQIILEENLRIPFNPKLMNQLSKQKEKENLDSKATMIEKDIEVIDSFPDLRWTAKQDTLDFQRNNIKQFIIEVLNTLDPNDIKGDEKKFYTNFISKFDYHKYIAKEVKETTETILKKLRYI